jgi:hypothetical protein
VAPPRPVIEYGVEVIPVTVVTPLAKVELVEYRRV